MFEINAHAKGIVLFGNHDDIGEPLGVVYLSDELCCKKPSHLFANGFFLMNGGPPKMFFNRFCF